MKLEILSIFCFILIVASLCESAELNKENVCNQNIEIGPCRAQYPRFGYNKNTKSCEPFKYGGCKGNDNNFETVAECEKLCKTE